LSIKETVSPRTQDEFADSIRRLTAADWGRLRKVAGYYARSWSIEPDDLLQEAFRRAFAGSRKWPANVDVVKFLAEAVRSIANGEKEKAGTRPVFVPISNFSEVENSVDPPDSRPNVEQSLQDEQEVAKIKTALLALFQGDEIAQIILEGRMENMQGDELRELTGLDSTAYESKCKLIRRRIDKKFPDGWKP